MIAGEGLAGVLIAFLVAASSKFEGLRHSLESVHFAGKNFTWMHGPAAVIAGVAVVLAVCWLLFRAGRSVAVEPS
ncbi:MAG: hypothetical protein ACXVJT_13030, partial [Thermoanaerobaculia bacterium]